MAVERKAKLEALMDMHTQLAAEFSSILTQLLAQGFEPPIMVLSVSVNGTYMAAVYEQAQDTMGLTLRDVAQSWLDVGEAGGGEDRTMMLPIHMMLVDARGEAAHVEITSAGTGKPQIVH